MAGEAAADRHRVVAREPTQQELFVLRIGLETGPHRQRRAGRRREMSLRETPVEFLLGGGRIGVHAVGIDSPKRLAGPAELEPRNVVDRKAVAALLAGPDHEGRKPIRREQFWPARLQPCHDRSDRDHRVFDRRDEVAEPRAGSDHQFVSLVPIVRTATVWHGAGTIGPASNDSTGFCLPSRYATRHYRGVPHDRRVPSVDTPVAT